MTRANEKTDPRGPMRKIVSVAKSAGPTLIMFDCGHITEHASHFHYEPGEQMRCVKCAP